MSKEVVIVSSSVACARVVWGRYWYSNAAFGPWCVWSGAVGGARDVPRDCRRRRVSADTGECRDTRRTRQSRRARRESRDCGLLCHALALSPRVVARCAE